jgi:hypothetical protein
MHSVVLLLNKHINYMEQSPSQEAISRAASQEIPCLLWNLKVHYCVPKNPPLDPILRQLNLVHTLPSTLRSSFYPSLKHFQSMFFLNMRDLKKYKQYPQKKLIL